MNNGPVSKRKISRRTRHNIIVASSAVLLALVLGWAVWTFLLAGNDSGGGQNANSRELTEEARSYSAQVAGFFDEVATSLTEYAASEELKALFSGEDDLALQQAADAGVARFPSGLKLRLLRPGTYAIDNSASPPLGFGSLALLNRAERSSGTIAAETLLFGSENEHIVMLERVKNEADQLIGLVHLSLNVRLLDEALSVLGPVSGYIEIIQSGTSNPLVLSSLGNSAYKTGESGATSISGTRWSLTYWSPPAQAVAASLFSCNTIRIAILLAVVVISILLALAFARRKKNPLAEVLDKPDVSYAGAIKNIMDGAHPGMEKLIAHLPGRKSGAVATPGLSEGMEGADITSFMSTDDLKAAAESDDVFDITGSGGGDDQAEAPEATPTAPAPQRAKPSPAVAAPSKPVPATKEGGAADSDELPEVIFRKYDIRGIVGDSLTPQIVEKIGRAVGSQASEASLKTFAVGRDGRQSSPELAESLIKGLRASGINVIDIGVVPTPVLYFATHHLKTGSGIMITGSHNGPEYNGLKIVMGGNTLSEDGIRGIYDRIRTGDFSDGNGALETQEVIPDYVRRISEDIPVAFGNTYKLVIDCGNGAASVVAPQLYRAMGHDVIDLYCELDGNFPNHHPDPSQPENLAALIEKVKSEQADLGFAFDGDGDRLGVVDAQGNILWPDRQMMVFARDVLSRNPGAEIIFDVKCSSHLKKIIEQSGGKALMWKTGHSLIKSKMKAVEAPLAGEMSGHIFFGERWYGFDDALYSGARMLEILTNAKANPAEFFAELPGGVSTPELRIDMPESKHQEFMQQLESKIDFDDASIVTVDGFRIEFEDGWGLIRPSNTTPCLVARFEADTQEALERIQGRFKELLLSINPDLSLSF